MLNIYRASAGSGKTFRLTKDYIRLLFSNLHNDRAHRKILAVTFTNKATDEMKSRILQDLHQLSIGEKSDYRQELMDEFKLSEAEVNTYAGKILIHILHDYSSFSISTIDKFFQQVIRAFAREIGVNGGYNLELDSDSVLQQAVDNLFLDLSNDENKLLLDWMTRFAEEQVEQSATWNIKIEILKLGAEIFKENYQHKADETNIKLHDRNFLKEYLQKLRKIKSDFENKVKEEADNTLMFLATNGLQPEYFTRLMMHKTLENLSNGSFEIKDTFRSYAVSSDKCYTKSQSQAIKNAIESAYHSGLKNQLDKIIELLSSGIINYNTADLILKHINTLGILSDLAMQIKKITSEQNIMLISDTNLLLNKIIDNSETPFVYERTGLNIDHYMIDEFQDTSVLQWKNFKPLISNSIAANNYNMVVGDVKQSIYRWRNSDWKLLDEQIELDFSIDQFRKKNLDTNWRSDRNIIEFNNAFFRKASLLLQLKFNENVNEALSITPEMETLTHKIVHAYTDIEQKISDKAAEGHVKFEFIPQDENEDGWKQASMERIPNLIEDLTDQGYKPSDIAFLVRTNKEEADLIQFLLSFKNSENAREGYTYDIVGNEGLMLVSSASVNFIIAVLKLMANPDDSVQRTILTYEYVQGKKQTSANDTAIDSFGYSKDDDTTIFSSFFTPEENAFLTNSRQSSLYNLIENLITVFDIQNWHNESVFLQAFQDVVFKFVNTRNADLNSFLLWWDKIGCKQTISTPENQNTLHIMTIHKSKGLDFKVVILPFCNWALDAAKNRPMLWCQPEVEPFNELPLLPIEYSSRLTNSIFQKQYFDEQMHQYIDSLNMAYVAFTRARNEMICFVPKPKTGASAELSKMQSLSDLIMTSFFTDKTSDNKHIELSAGYSEENNVYELGQPTKAVNKEQPDKTKYIQLNDYPIADSLNRLNIKHLSIDYWLTNQKLTDSKLNYGTIMHEILQKITKCGDEEKIIQELIFEGKINQEESVLIKNTMKNFWELPQIENWFFSDGKILNEATILLPEGEIYRPDRVIINDNKAIITDYKFGTEKRTSHQKQIRRYGEIIRKMNYEPEMYIVYVTLGEVEKV